MTNQKTNTSNTLTLKIKWEAFILSGIFACFALLWGIMATVVLLLVGKDMAWSAWVMTGLFAVSGLGIGGFAGVKLLFHFPLLISFTEQIIRVQYLLKRLTFKRESLKQLRLHKRPIGRGKIVKEIVFTFKNGQQFMFDEHDVRYQGEFEALKKQLSQLYGM